MVHWSLKCDIMTTDATYASPRHQPTPLPAAGRFLIDTAPIRIAPNPFAPNTIQFPNRRKTSHFDKSPGFSPFTIHRTSNRNCPELEIAVTPLPSSKLGFLIATASEEHQRRKGKWPRRSRNLISGLRPSFPKMGQVTLPNFASEIAAK